MHHIHNILNTWYSEYLRASFLTEYEYIELISLCDIITEKLGPLLIEKWSRDAVKSLLPTIIPSGPIVCRLNEFHERELKGEQGTEQWLNERLKYITASISAACAGLMGPSARENNILEKASNGKYRSFFGGYYTAQGNIFEEVTNLYYGYVNNGKIWAFNLIPNIDPEYYFLAASTDGVTNRLINIEIKTLVGRHPDPENVKKEYYHQMQHQMECLQLHETDFIEVKYSEHSNFQQALINCTENISKMGIIIESWNTLKQKMEYEYSKIGDCIKTLQQWECDRTDSIATHSTKLYIRSIYWTMADYLCRRIKRDPMWIKEMGPKLKMFNDEVIKLRNNPKELQKRIAAKALKSSSRKKKYKTDFEAIEKCLL
uniref:YqaJ viral recombinase domain-containing protein n=1 Tax=viral metagenome TaxID=1070528 RepID=A0A6C0JBN1_9ZZZZ